MSTKKIVSHAHAHKTAPATTDAEATVLPTAAAAAPAPVLTATTASPAPSAPAAASGNAIIFAPPPANAQIPAVPPNAAAGSGTSYRGVAPRMSELVALPLAVGNLEKFTDYTQRMGTAAPPYDEVTQLCEVVNSWSSMRAATEAWDAYCRDQEGIGWILMRAMMDRLQPAFMLAAKSDPSLVTKYSGLATLLGAKKAIATKGVATRKANKQSAAKGEPQTHGKVGKAKKRAAEKAALVTLQQQEASPPVASAPPPAVVTSPAAAPATPPPPLMNGVNGAANGAGH